MDYIEEVNKVSALFSPSLSSMETTALSVVRRICVSSVESRRVNSSVASTIVSSMIATLKQACCMVSLSTVEGNATTVGPERK